MNRPDRRTRGPEGTGPPAVPHWVRRREIAGRSCALGSIGPHSQDTRPRLPELRLPRPDPGRRGDGQRPRRLGRRRQARRPPLSTHQGAREYPRGAPGVTPGAPRGYSRATPCHCVRSPRLQSTLHTRADLPALGTPRPDGAGPPSGWWPTTPYPPCCARSRTWPSTPASRPTSTLPSWARAVPPPEAAGRAVMTPARNSRRSLWPTLKAATTSDLRGTVAPCRSLRLLLCPAAAAPPRPAPPPKTP
jgi:hypothetical protein